MHILGLPLAQDHSDFDATDVTYSSDHVVEAFDDMSCVNRDRHVMIKSLQVERWHGRGP
jgi:hypothetical protein